MRAPHPGNQPYVKPQPLFILPTCKLFGILTALPSFTLDAFDADWPCYQRNYKVSTMALLTLAFFSSLAAHTVGVCKTPQKTRVRHVAAASMILGECVILTPLICGGMDLAFDSANPTLADPTPGALFSVGLGLEIISSALEDKRIISVLSFISMVSVMVGLVLFSDTKPVRNGAIAVTMASFLLLLLYTLVQCCKEGNKAQQNQAHRIWDVNDNEPLWDLASNTLNAGQDTEAQPTTQWRFLTDDHTTPPQPTATHNF